MLPVLVSQMVVVLKDTAIGYQITFLEMVRQGTQVGSAYGNYIPALIVIAVLMIMRQLRAVGAFATWLEGRMRRSRSAARHRMHVDSRSRRARSARRDGASGPARRTGPAGRDRAFADDPLSAGLDPPTLPLAGQLGLDHVEGHRLAVAAAGQHADQPARRPSVVVVVVELARGAACRATSSLGPRPARLRRRRRPAPRRSPRRRRPWCAARRPRRACPFRRSRAATAPTVRRSPRRRPARPRPAGRAPAALTSSGYPRLVSCAASSARVRARAVSRRRHSARACSSRSRRRCRRLGGRLRSRRGGQGFVIAGVVGHHGADAELLLDLLLDLVGRRRGSPAGSCGRSPCPGPAARPRR